MYDAEHSTDAQHSSPTAIACEQAELFGATPGPDEPDNRDLWDEDDAMHAVDSAFHAFAGDVARDGTQLADERESFLWGFVNLFHAQNCCFSVYLVRNCSNSAVALIDETIRDAGVVHVAAHGRKLAYGHGSASSRGRWRVTRRAVAKRRSRVAA